MYRRVLIAIGFFAAAGLIAAVRADDEPKEKKDSDAKKESKEVILDERFAIVASDDQMKEVGEYRIKANRLNDDGKIEILESFEYLDPRRKEKAAGESTVIYQIAPAVKPLEAKADTKVGDQRQLSGTMTFHKDSLDAKNVAYIDRVSGAPIDSPITERQLGIPLPTTPMVFKSAVPVIGPLLIKKGDAGIDVQILAFPSDNNFPEVFDDETRARMTRSEPDSEGKYWISMFDHAARLIRKVQFDKDDKLVAIHGFGAWKLVKKMAEQKTEK